jgi:outer membrane protein
MRMLLILTLVSGAPVAAGARSRPAAPSSPDSRPAPSASAAQEPLSPNRLELSLDEAAELARMGATRVERAERSARIAELQVKSARAAYYPRVDVAISANQSARGSAFRASDVAFRQGLVGDFRGGVSVNASVPIDIAGIIGRQVKSSRINETIASLEVDRARKETVADVQIAYLAALQAQNALELDRQVIASIRRLIGNAARKAPQVVSFLGLELANSQQLLATRDAALDQAKDNLKRLLGIEPGTDVVLTSTLPAADGLKGLIQDREGASRLDERLDLAIARHRLDQAELTVKRSGDQRKPSIRAGVYLDQFFGGEFVSDTGETSTRSVGLNLSLNFPVLNFDAGQSGNSKKIAKLQAEQARSDLRDARRQAEYEWKQARASWTRAIQRLDVLPNAKDAAKALAFAERNLLSASAEDAPSRLAQLSNARAAWRSAEGAVRDAIVELATAAIRLRKAEGRVIDSAELDRTQGTASRS